MDKNDDAASVENIPGPTRPHLSKSSTAFSPKDLLDGPSKYESRRYSTPEVSYFLKKSEEKSKNDI